MVSALISRVVILVFGTLYPAYSSYKAVKTKNVKEYVKWMMYWIVFALFTTVETFADVLVSWFPFYYELKIAFVVWLLSPATKGSSVLYRKFVHPELMKREGEIDNTLERVKTQGYTALVNVGQQGINFAVQKAMTGQNMMMENLMKKSFSMGDLSQQPPNTKVTYQPTTENIPEAADEIDRGGASGTSGASIPVIPGPVMLEENTLQGGDGAATAGQYTDVPLPPAQELNASQSGYNLRSHEFHDSVTLDSHGPSNYKHSESILKEAYHIVQEKTTSNIQASKAKDPLTRKPQRSPAKRRPMLRSRSVGRRRRVVAKASTQITQ